MCVDKAWNSKHDTTEMARATNEGCIGWLLENCNLMEEKMRFLIAKDLSLFREIFVMGEMSKFLAVR